MDLDAQEQVVPTPEKQGLASLLGSPGSNRGGPNRFSLTPSLTQVVAKGDIRQLKAMLEEGVDEIDARSPNGSTALMVAAKYGKLEAVKLLLEFGAKTIPEAKLAAVERDQTPHQQEILTVLSRRR